MNKVKFSKELNLQISTPKVRVIWANLHQPNTKFDADGVYDVTVVMTAEQMKPIKDRIDGMLKTAEAEYKATYKKKPNIASSHPCVPEVDKLTGEETGNWLLKVKLKSVTVVNGSPTKRRPVVVDSQLKPMGASTPVGKGSTVCVNFNVYPYYVPALGLGASAKLVAVQVIKCEAFAGANDPLKGFSKEDGFVSEDVAIGDTGSEGTQVDPDADF